MRKKLKLESLDVDSFPTTGVRAKERGTVRGAGDDCTCVDSCPCPTNAYYCATVMATVISCAYTENASCAYDTQDESCGCSWVGCPSYPVCMETEEC
ncbi:MAG TPA: hypothetical protein VF092_03515 [Longimicrobium sp.]